MALNNLIPNAKITNRAFSVRSIINVGFPYTIGTVTITVLAVDPTGPYITSARGAFGTQPTFPSLPANTFAVGAELINTSNGVRYVNVGSVATPAFASTPAGNKRQVNSITIATTGATNVYMTAPITGNIRSVIFAGTDALAASDSNYITWTITNLGQAGAGTATVLAAADSNTTKSTGGSAIAADTKRALTVNGTAANVLATAGDRLKITATVTGTLANTVTFPVYEILFV